MSVKTVALQEFSQVYSVISMIDGFFMSLSKKDTCTSFKIKNNISTEEVGNVK